MMNRRFLAVLFAIGFVGACAAAARDVPFVATPPAVVERMLGMAQAGPNDVVYDLGSGDGRIVVSAVRDFGVRKAVGVDIDPDRVTDGMQAARVARVSDRTEFVEADIFEFDFSEATVVTMYLLPEVNLKLRPRILSELEPGTRVVSHRFDMDGWVPDEEATVGGRRVYLWIVPARAGGAWSWSADGEPFEMRLDQRFQRVSGTLWAFDRAVPIDDAVLTGDRLAFDTRIDNGERNLTIRFVGRVNGDRLDGEFQVGDRTTEIAARRTE